MVASYIGSIAEKGAVAAASLQPYLSAINSMHSDFGFDKPGVGHLVFLVRRGLPARKLAPLRATAASPCRRML
jgi:hypothetical protein